MEVQANIRQWHEPGRPTRDRWCLSSGFGNLIFYFSKQDEACLTNK